MIHQIRVLLSIVLAAPAFVLVVVALWLRIRSDHVAITVNALRFIQANEELDGHYIPKTGLLSPGGIQMRRRGNRLLVFGAIFFALALLNHSTL